MSSFASRISELSVLLRTKGKVGMVRHYGRHLLGSKWKPFEYGLAGKIVELRGNVVTIDGCKFNVADPVISSSEKWGLLFNYYESVERMAVRQFLPPDLPVVELGACLGIVSCISNKKLTDPRQHVAVEANPKVLPTLELNRVLNRCEFSILHRALAYGSPTVIFYENTSLPVSGLQRSTQRSALVPATTLQSILDSANFATCSLICDIEGAESDLLKYEAGLLAERVKVFIVEFHPHLSGEDRVAEMCRHLTEAGFRQVFQHFNVYTFVRAPQ